MKTLASLVIATALGFSLAQESGGFVQEAPHEHGAASLNVVLEDDALSMAFISPAVNLVGFEYEPSGEEDVKAVEDALAQLEAGKNLFTPAEAAGCELTSAETEHVMSDEEGHDEGEDHSEEEGEEHEGEEGARHSEFHADYMFTCAQPDSLSNVNLSELFALYPGIEDLDVQYVLPGGQGAVELNPSSVQLSF